MGWPQDRSGLTLNDRACGRRHKRGTRAGAAIARLASRVLARARVPVFDLPGFDVEPFEPIRGTERRESEPGNACAARPTMKNWSERGHEDRQSDQPGPVFARSHRIFHARILAVRIRQLQLR